jgi:hypothetical protein
MASLILALDEVLTNICLFADHVRQAGQALRREEMITSRINTIVLAPAALGTRLTTITETDTAVITEIRTPEVIIYCLGCV